MKVKLKAEPLYNRILLLINRVKGYLNEVGRKHNDFLHFSGFWVKGYLNEVGRKPMIHFGHIVVRVKGYLN